MAVSTINQLTRNFRLRVAIIGLSLALCMFATFYSLIVLEVSFAYIVLFFAPIVLASAWWHRKGVILTFGIVVFLLIINFYFPPPVSITGLVRAAILLLVSILTSAIFRHKKRLEDKLRILSKFPSENPNPVFRIAKDGTVLYANPAAKSQLSELKVEIGQPAPPHLRRLVADALNSGLSKEVEVEYRNQVFLFTLAPMIDAAYVNVHGIDISERKKAGEALSESEEKHRKLFEEAMDAIFVADAETGIIVDCNRAALDLVGHKKAELVGQHQSVLHPQEEIEGGFTRGFKQHLKEQDSVHETKVITKKGEIKDVAIKANLIEIKGRKMLQGIFRDTTELKKAEEELVRLSSAVKMSTDSIVISDLDGKIIDANEATLKMYGTDDKRDLIGKNAFELIVPEEREKALADMREVLEKGYFKSREYHIITKVGRKIPVGMSVAIMKDADGKPIGFVSINRDITERKQAEEALRNSEEKFRNIFEGVNDEILFLDKYGKIVDVNKRVEDIFGYKRDEVIGKNFARLGVLTPKDLPIIFKQFMDAMRGGVVYPLREYEIKDKKGNIVLVEASTRLVKKDGKIDGLLVIVRDISKRKKAEEALRESEEKYRNLFENARDVIFTGDLKGNITDINRYIEEYGFKRDEVVGKNMLKFVPKKYWSRLIKDVAKVSHGNVVEGEIEIITPKGKIISEYRGNPIKREKKAVGFQTILRNITERKKMEDAIGQERDKLEAVTENIGAGLAIISKDYRILWANKLLKQTFGNIENKICYSTFNIIDTICPDCGVKKVFENGVSFDSHEYRNPFDETGKDRWIQLIVTPLKDKDGTVIAALELAVEITEKKLMQNKLEEYSQNLEQLVAKRTGELLESEKRYSVLVEEASDGVVIVQDEKIVFINRKGAEISYHSKDELIGHPFEQLLDEKYRQSIKEGYALLLQGETVPLTVEVEVIAKNGEIVPVEVSVTRIYHQSRPAVLAMLRDIRERKRMEEQRSKLERLAAIGELAAMVGHDLRNPLTGIKNAAYYLKKKQRAYMDNSGKEMLEIIDSAIEHANRVINDLLDYSREIHLELVECSPQSLLKAGLSMIQIPDRVKILDYTLNEPKMRADMSKMERVFINLIKNAVDAMPEGGTLEIRSTQTNGNVEIVFADTGVGIPENIMAKLFTPLITTKAQGMGFGLAFCKRVVETHGGKITVESVVDRGTTFTVTLPIEPKLEDGGEKEWVIPQESLLSTTMKT